MTPAQAPVFAAKAAAREHVWARLEREGLARFPYPPQGRIPNFAGAARAAERLLDAPPLRAARRVKCNPDAPQRPLRAALLAAGVELFMPTPRLRGGFMRLDPARIPAAERSRAASLSQAKRYGEPVALRALPALDAIVCGSVAVTRAGARCGKGEGYSDIEYAILRELGHPPAPVLTSVHAVQIVGGFPTDPGDLPLHWIATPDALLEVAEPVAPPSGLDWSRLSDDDLAAMPVLRELRPKA